MGYRSVGKLYLTPKVYDMLTNKLKEELENDWEVETTSFDNDDCMIWAFYDWKWYNSYTEVKQWNELFNMLEQDDDVNEEDWDFIAIGEDSQIVDHRTQTHFAVSSNIEIF